MHGNTGLAEKGAASLQLARLASTREPSVVQLTAIAYARSCSKLTSGGLHRKGRLNASL